MKVPHYKQSRDGVCLPACVRMVLAAYDHKISEQALVNLFDTTIGTPFRRLDRLKSLGFNVDRTEKSIEQLIQAVKDGISPIVSVRAEYLSWTSFVGPHALVLVSVEGDQLSFNDPAQNQSPVITSLDEFMIAWIEHGELCALISPSTA